MDLPGESHVAEVDLPGENEGTSESSDEEEDLPSDQIEMKRGRIASASLRDLVSGFGECGVPSEEEIARSMGVEQLTRLGRATSARVVVDTLQLDPTALDKILSTKYKPMEGKKDGPALR